MVDFKKLKRKKGKKLFLIVYKNDNSIYGGTPLKVTSWEKEYEKYYNALTHNNENYRLECYYSDKITSNNMSFSELFFEDEIKIK